MSYTKLEIKHGYYTEKRLRDHGNRVWHKLVEEARQRDFKPLDHEENILIVLGIISSLFCLAVFFAFFLVKIYG